MEKRQVFKVEGDKIVSQRKNCPKCGDGLFLADHKDRARFWKCGYNEFKTKKQEEEKPKE